jgi:exodeoxyribonuclease VII large subunit
MLQIIERRWPGREILLVPVQVQGEAAPQAVAGGIQLLNQVDGVDLIITGRGGGSLEELWAFNTEIVAQSIFQSRVPVISAVGHETDTTIADFVADVRAATPSAAAELSVPDRKDMDRYIHNLKNRLARMVDEKLANSRRRFESCLSNRVFSRSHDVICGMRQQQLDQLEHRLQKAVYNSFERSGNRFAVLAGRLNTLSPLATLSRGYSICTTQDGKKVISDAAAVQKGERLNLLLHKGKLECIVASKSVIP